jgi:hypothetical protein
LGGIAPIFQNNSCEIGEKSGEEEKPAESPPVFA